MSTLDNYSRFFTLDSRLFTLDSRPLLSTFYSRRLLSTLDSRLLDTLVSLADCCVLLNIRLTCTVQKYKALILRDPKKYFLKSNICIVFDRVSRVYLNVEGRESRVDVESRE